MFPAVEPETKKKREMTCLAPFFGHFKSLARVMDGTEAIVSKKKRTKNEQTHKIIEYEI